MLRCVLTTLLTAVSAVSAPARSTRPAMVPAASDHAVRPSRTSVVRITSKDGTPIAMECAGTGPTVIMVHGGVGDRTRWTPLIPLLSKEMTACAMDRRAHGESGNALAYSLEKEAEDIASAVESRPPGPVFVLGHSYGGVAALEACFLTTRIAKLVLYEPPVQDPVERNLQVADRMERLIAQGKRDEALVLFETKIVQLSDSAVAGMRSQPAWSNLVATIDLQLRQVRALAHYRFDRRRIQKITQPTLLLIGGRTSSPYLKRAIALLRLTLPNATSVTLDGQEHNAMDSAREVLADTVRSFLRSEK